MDIQTRIGIGAGALFALAGIGAPLMGWAVSSPIMMICAAINRLSPARGAHDQRVDQFFFGNRDGFARGYLCA
jgi:hypothetical protein